MDHFNYHVRKKFTMNRMKSFNKAKSQIFKKTVCYCTTLSNIHIQSKCWTPVIYDTINPFFEIGQWTIGRSVQLYVLGSIFFFQREQAPVVGQFTDSDCNINLIFASFHRFRETHIKHLITGNTNRTETNTYILLIQCACNMQSMCSNVSKLKVDAKLDPDEQCTQSYPSCPSLPLAHEAHGPQR